MPDKTWDELGDEFLGELRAVADKFGDEVREDLYGDLQRIGQRMMHAIETGDAAKRDQLLGQFDLLVEQNRIRANDAAWAAGWAALRTAAKLLWDVGP